MTTMPTRPARTTTRTVRDLTPAGPGRLRMRAAHRHDATRLAEIVSSSADMYADFVDEEDMKEHEVDEAWALRNMKKREFHVGEVDGETVGTISLQVFGDWMYLGYVYLDVEHTGNGYGKRFLEFAERIARLRGLAGLCLIAHPEAHWACKAYERFGFERTATDRDEILSWNDGVLESYYEEGFHLFQMPLDASGD